jgi:aryl-alcohol dehydrogenase-like predicted oxidoreductase
MAAISLIRKPSYTIFPQCPSINICSANNYQNEDSEAWVGEWMEKRGVRDQIVLATKYTSGFRSHKKSEIQANFVGNNTKSMRLSVNASLKKLRTDYIDLVR